MAIKVAFNRYYVARALLALGALVLLASIGFSAEMRRFTPLTARSAGPKAQARSVPGLAASARTLPSFLPQPHAPPENNVGDRFESARGVLSAAPGSALPAADDAPSIRKLADREFTVERRALDAMLENQVLAGRPRVEPQIEASKAIGVRLFGIRPHTWLATLGLENGDRLDAINGLNVGTPENALKAYSRLRKAVTLNLSLNRRGKPMTIVIHVR